MSLVNAATWIRYCARDASRPAQWPRLSAWLTEREQSALVELRSSARQAQWLSGRWISKQLLSHVLEVEQLTDIEIITRNEQALGIRPQVTLSGRPWRGALSISHTASGVLVGLSLDDRKTIGVDLSCDVPQDVRFRSLWFTPREQQWIASEPVFRTGLVWGLKEALFKACGSGHAWTPTQIEIHPTSENGYKATFFGTSLGLLDVHVQTVARGLAVVVCLARQDIFPLDSSPAQRNHIVRRPLVSPTDFTNAPATTKEFVATEMPAFAAS